jgi:hypothetical protein
MNITQRSRFGSMRCLPSGRPVYKYIFNKCQYLFGQSRLMRTCSSNSEIHCASFKPSIFSDGSNISLSCPLMDPLSTKGLFPINHFIFDLPLLPRELRTSLTIHPSFKMVKLKLKDSNHICMNSSVNPLAYII